MARELTPRMEQIVDLRRARMSFRQIAKILGLNDKTVHESYQRALKYIDNENAIPAGISTHTYYKRIEELEYIDARLRDYQEVFQLCKDKGKYFNAIQALNGQYKFVELAVKIQGISEPEKHEVSISMEALRGELAKIEAEIGQIVDGEVVAQKEITA